VREVLEQIGGWLLVIAAAFVIRFVRAKFRKEFPYVRLWADFSEPGRKAKRRRS
jgi:hypothetical protein